MGGLEAPIREMGEVGGVLEGFDDEVGDEKEEKEEDRNYENEDDDGVDGSDGEEAGIECSETYDSY